MKTCVYPGSFDPVTNGHMDIIKRSAKMFDKVIVAVVKNYSKKPLFSFSERMELIQKSVKDIPNVEVESFEGLLMDYVHKKNAQVIVKGLRAISDFEYEFQMALMNRKLDPNVETIFLMTNHKYSFLSSSMVKEVASLGGCISGLVPDCIIRDIYRKLKQKD
ncbi:MAG: pantetheine-phosphate adenylyltransferase [Caldicoprobacterales bacterium]|nr:pantetheine-phosphate adenylyltransferase [Clostridiales bacterium]